MASVGAAVDSASRAVAIRVTRHDAAPRAAAGRERVREIATGDAAGASSIPWRRWCRARNGQLQGVRRRCQGRRRSAREVTIGGRTETKVEILEGLKAGETVVTKGAYGLEDSAKVTKPVPVNAVSGAAVGAARVAGALDARRRRREPAPLRLPRRRAAVRRRASGRRCACRRRSIPSCSSRASPSSRRARRSARGRWCSPITRPIEEAVGDRARGDARAVALHPRCERDIGDVRPSTDMAYALQQTQARVNQMRGELPPGLELEVERLSPSLFPIISYNLEGGEPGEAVRHRALPDRAGAVARAGRGPRGRAGVGRARDRGDRRSGAARRAGAVVRRRCDCHPQRRRRRAPWGAWRRTTSSTSSSRRRRPRRRRTSRTWWWAAGCVCATSPRWSVGTEDHVRIVAGDGRPAALLNITRQVGGNTVAIADSVEKRGGDAARRRCPRA